MTVATFKPMLASECTDLNKVRLPAYISPKYDGVRSIVTGGRFVARSLEPIRNEYIQSLCKPEWAGLDGELIIGSPTDPDVFHYSSGRIRKAKAKDLDFRFYVFDIVMPQPFKVRYAEYLARTQGDPHLISVQQIYCETKQQIEDNEKYFLELGYEGIMIRSVDGIYKYGRSTETEGYLLKRKPFEDSEAVIVGFECEYENTNEATLDELGHTKRSSAKAGKVPKEMLGKFICEHPVWGLIKISGFKRGFAEEVWQNKEKYLGQIVTFRYQKIGTKDKPRIAKFKGIRDKIDMSN